MSTKKERKYLRIWFPRLERLARAGFRCIGFDPGFLVHGDDKHQSFDLPSGAARKIEELVITVDPTTSSDAKMMKAWRRRKERELAASEER